MEKYKSIAVHARATYWTTKELNDEAIVDSDDLAKEVSMQCNILDNEGYDIVSVTPINSGSISGGNGFYQTESVLILAKLKS
ncbi:MAG: hypothetical protein JXB49_18015 [Bacteroidales bacterium]|nr:hypothetical protein [Bacteroidales bacterium]